ncbi:MAG TPA: hypothetical protein PLB01_00730 [Thermoanaerobaculia bacterium]|nr:hypothetical protein [Thermoanaerobaculia bacterium]
MPGGNRFAGVFDTAVGSTMRPGDPGTAKLTRDWGERLVSVRYRYAADPPMRFTTIEIVVDAAPWKPSPARPVLVEVRSWESALRKRIVEAGGQWDARAGRWRIRYDKVLALDLGARVQLTKKARGRTRRSKISTPEGTPTSLPKPKPPRNVGRGA